MKIYKSNEEVKKDIVNNVLKINDDVKNFKCLSIQAKRKNSIHRCLDNEIIFKEKIKKGNEIIELDGKKYKLIKEKS